MAELTKDCRQQGQTFNTYYMPEGSHLWTNLSCTVTQITPGFVDENIKVGRSYVTHLTSPVNNDEAGVCTFMWVCLGICTRTGVLRVYLCTYLCLWCGRVCVRARVGLLVCVELHVWGAHVWHLVNSQFCLRLPRMAVTPGPILSPFPSFFPPSCVSRQSHLNWFSLEEKTKPALSKLQILLPAGKSITINQIRWREKKQPGTC